VARASQADVRKRPAPRCARCGRTSMHGADFWQNRARDTGCKQECIDCIAEANGAESAYELGADGMSFKEIGKVLGVSAERVRQIEASALRKLRNNAYVQRMLRRMMEGR